MAKFSKKDRYRWDIFQAVDALVASVRKSPNLEPFELESDLVAWLEWRIGKGWVKKNRETWDDKVYDESVKQLAVSALYLYYTRKEK